jgi:L-gulonolactone oxidase
MMSLLYVRSFMCMQVTLALQPMFKRSVTFVTRDDSDMAETVSVWGHLHEFGDMTWLPYQRKVVYRQDDRVDVATGGDGHNDFLGFRFYSKPGVMAARLLGVLAACCEDKLTLMAFKNF